MLVAIKVAFAVIAALGAGFHLAAPMSQPSVSAPSGALFAAGSPLVPGRAVDRSFDVSTSGATYLGLYMTGLHTSCPAPDAASRLQLTVIRDGRPVYAGDVDDFARTHSAPSSALQVEPGTFDFRIRLDPTVDNSYQGCSSQVDINWMVAQ